MKARLILVALGVAMLTMFSLGIEAQERAAQEKDDIITSEQQLARQFADFQDALLKLKQRLARGNADERKRAVVLDKILEECKTLAVNQEFTKMLEILRTANLKSTQGVDVAKEQSENLTIKLRTILDMLQNSKLDLSADRKALEDIIRNLQKAIDDQRQVQARTELKKTDAKELESNQKDSTKKTEEVGKQIDKYLDKDGKGQGGEAANLKGENKEGKGEGAKGEAKNAGDQKGKEGARGESRDGGKDNKGGAKGEAKPGDQKGGQPKSGEGGPKSEAKPGGKGQEGSPQAKSNDNKSGAKGGEGSAKENKGGDKGAKGSEGGAKDSGSKDPMKGGEQGSAKGGEEKKGGGDPKSGSPDSAAKPGGGESGGGGEKPQASTKTPDAGSDKGGDSKGGDAKADGGAGGQGDAKSGDSKDGQGAAKGGGGDPAGGGGGSPPPGGSAKDSPPPGGGGQPPPPGGAKDDDVAKSKKQLQEAGYDQKIAEDKIPQGQNNAAAKAQGDAIKKMEEAKKKLEKLLQQMREDEIERVLAALQARCEKMLIMQLEVLAGTEDLDKVVQKNADKKPTQADKLASLKLSDKEKLIVQEADKCIDILESEGTAVAFPEVFQQIRADMKHVQKRLEVTDVGDVTIGIEKDIVATLTEMIDALTKARDDNQSDPGKPGKGGKAGPPGDKKLLELLQELKMVRSLQKRVNDRTVDYAKRFPNQEQTNDPQIVRELRSLAERQLRIQEIVANIAKGANK